MLDPDVVLRVDGGTQRAGATRVVQGARAVAEGAMRFAFMVPLARQVFVNGALGFIGRHPDGRIVSVMGMTTPRRQDRGAPRPYRRRAAREARPPGGIILRQPGQPLPRRRFVIACSVNSLTKQNRRTEEAEGMTDQRAQFKLPAGSLDRREFIKVAGFAVLAVQCLPATAHASGIPLRDVNRVADDLIIESGPGAFHHVHYLRIPNAFLTSPPAQGAELTSTRAFLHQHRIVLTQEELRGVNQGGTVIQRASSHVFVIALAKRTTQRTFEQLVNAQPVTCRRHLLVP